jgi:hypothetical protein
VQVGACLTVGIHHLEIPLCDDVQTADGDPTEQREELLVGRGTEDQASRGSGHPGRGRPLVAEPLDDVGESDRLGRVGTPRDSVRDSWIIAAPARRQE